MHAYTHKTVVVEWKICYAEETSVTGPFKTNSHVKEFVDLLTVHT